MNGQRNLSVAFLRKHPAEAARVLEQAEPRLTGALLPAIPGRVAGPVLARLLPAFAAQALVEIPDDAAVRLLRRVNTPSAAAVLRHVPDDRRQRLLGELPSAMGMACRLLLNYPEDSIGALSDTGVVTVLAGTPVRDVLARLKSLRDEIGDFLYVVDDERHLRGCLRPSSLLHATGNLSVGALEAVNVPALPAQAAPRSVRDHPGWNSFSTLPVVDRHHRLIGALRQGVLMRALERAAGVPIVITEPGTLEAFGAFVWAGLSMLLHAVVSVLPKSRSGAP